MLLPHPSPSPCSGMWMKNSQRLFFFFFPPKTLKTKDKIAARPEPFPHLNQHQDNIETWKDSASQTQLCLRVLRCQGMGRAGKSSGLTSPVQKRSSRGLLPRKRSGDSSHGEGLLGLLSPHGPTTAQRTKGESKGRILRAGTGILAWVCPRHIDHHRVPPGRALSEGESP